MQTKDLILAFESFAPTYLANEWDNVGLLVGSSSWSADSILLTIDLTEAVMKEAINMNVDIIVSYHPPIFKPLTSVTDNSFKERVVLEAISNHIAIYSPHTALDVATGGVNDWIAECLGKGDVRALRPFGNLPPDEECKLITFCPQEKAEELRSALSSVGLHLFPFGGVRQVRALQGRVPHRDEIVVVPELLRIAKLLKQPFRIYTRLPFATRQIHRALDLSPLCL